MKKAIVGLLTAGAMTTAGITTASGAAPAPVRLAIPAPTGPDQVGTMTLHFTDQHRADPWVPQQKRQIMASVWYPAHDAAKFPVARQLPSAAAKAFDAYAAGSLNIPSGTVDWGATTTAGHVGAPVASGRHPVVLYSPGLGDPRSWDTTLVEDLASHGYVVVTVDHSYESAAVELPDGTVLDNTQLLKEFHQTTDPIGLLKKVMKARIADTEYVIDHLRSAVPAKLAATMDLDDIGMFGHSGGGFEALQLMHDDSRIRAAMDLDGIVGWDEDDTGPGLSQLARTGLKGPFVLMGSATNDHYTSTSWAQLWQNSRGWHRDIHLRGAQHASYTDAEALIPQIASQRKLPPEATAEIGWIRPAQAITIERSYVNGFFDRWLRGRDSGVFDRDRFPQASTVH